MHDSYAGRKLQYIIESELNTVKVSVAKEALDHSSKAIKNYFSGL